jgi:AcrR family transcriptional regulator
MAGSSVTLHEAALPRRLSWPSSPRGVTLASMVDPAVARPKKTKPARRPPGAQLGEDTVRAMVLSGGSRVFAAHGVRNASVEDILVAAQISRRTFYRFYDGKEAVMLALYQLGTEGLLQACKLALATESDPIRLLERCIDAHLANAQGLGRLVFVLGGEAQRHESPLHARRGHVHAQLAELMASAVGRKRVDPWLFRGLILAMEGITRLMLDECDGGRHVTAEAVSRARRAMRRVATATVAGEGPGVAGLPKAP